MTSASTVRESCWKLRFVTAVCKNPSIMSRAVPTKFNVNNPNRCCLAYVKILLNSVQFCGCYCIAKYWGVSLETAQIDVTLSTSKAFSNRKCSKDFFSDAPWENEKCRSNVSVLKITAVLYAVCITVMTSIMSATSIIITGILHWCLPVVVSFYALHKVFMPVIWCVDLKCMSSRSS